MDHFVDVIIVSEIRESRNIKLTEESNIKRVYAFQIRDRTDCRIVRTWAWEQGIKDQTLEHDINHARHVGLEVWKPLAPWHWRRELLRTVERGVD